MAAPSAAGLLLAACALLAAPAGAERALVIHAGGLVEPAGEERMVVPEAAGRLARVLIEEGDQVEAGQVLAELVNDEERARVALAEAHVAARQAELRRLLAGARREERMEARAALAEAEAALKLALSERNRRAPLVEDGQLPREVLDQAIAQAEAATARRDALAARHALIDGAPRSEDVALAEATLAAAESERALAQAALEKTRVRAPIAGTVLKRHLREGEFVAPLNPVPLATLGDLSQRFVRADIDELDIARVRMGQRAEVRSDALPDRVFAGRVTYVAGRMGGRNLLSGDPAQRRDMKILEALIELETGDDLPIGLRVDVRIVP
ncbi:MAG TPA: efflux RND transporter periplasmic adaptor subunit [Chiayiivirga sp.]|nr:efflux RND transporter periplasmic adaptor subunit [Chiayiivirga sp.]